jgi:ubiquinone/menaquinone biosynthesis C-methylase UbiE
MKLSVSRLRELWSKKKDADPHYVSDYHKHVDALIKNTESYDEAMSLAVGGLYDSVGSGLLGLLVSEGLAENHTLIDVGCGSGRVPAAITRQGILPNLQYVGTDVVQKLLDYAITKSRPGFRFLRHAEISIPVESDTADFVAFFSVFTHLLHEETYLYLQDAARVLKPGGKVVATFLEFEAAHQWPIFEGTVGQYQSKTRPHLNIFSERRMYRVFAEKLGYEEPVFSEGGQTVVVLKKT